MKYILFILVFLFSCANRSFQSFSYTESKYPWVNAFKDRVFFSAIKEAYKSDSVIMNGIMKKDALNPYDGLSLKEMQVADSLGILLIRKMPEPSMCEGCSAGVNYYMANSLHYYASKDLDDIAAKYYKMHLKNDKL